MLLCNPTLGDLASDWQRQYNEYQNGMNLLRAQLAAAKTAAEINSLNSQIAGLQSKINGLGPSPAPSAPISDGTPTPLPAPRTQTSSTGVSPYVTAYQAVGDGQTVITTTEVQTAPGASGVAVDSSPVEIQTMTAQDASQSKIPWGLLITLGVALYS